MEEVKSLIPLIPRLDISNNSKSSLVQSKYHFTVGQINPKELFHITLWNGHRQNKLI
jgi:hypothetical protein